MSRMDETTQRLTQAQAQSLADELTRLGLYALANAAQQISDRLKIEKSTGWYREICGDCCGTGFTRDLTSITCRKCNGYGIVMVDPSTGSEHKFYED